MARLHCATMVCKIDRWHHLRSWQTQTDFKHIRNTQVSPLDQSFTRLPPHVVGASYLYSHLQHPDFGCAMGHWLSTRQDALGADTLIMGPPKMQHLLQSFQQWLVNKKITKQNLIIHKDFDAFQLPTFQLLPDFPPQLLGATHQVILLRNVKVHSKSWKVQHKHSAHFGTQRNSSVLHQKLFLAVFVSPCTVRTSGIQLLLQALGQESAPFSMLAFTSCLVRSSTKRFPKWRSLLFKHFPKKHLWISFTGGLMAIPMAYDNLWEPSK